MDYPIGERMTDEDKQTKKDIVLELAKEIYKSTDFAKLGWKKAFYHNAAMEALAAAEVWADYQIKYAQDNISILTNQGNTDDGGSK